MGDEKIIKKSGGILKDLASATSNPVIQTGLATIAYLEPTYAVGAITIMATSTIRKMYLNRGKKFFKELDAGKIKLTPELAESEPWLHKFVCATRAALNTEQEEKIKLFARLLNTFSDKEMLEKTDEFEECLQALDQITYRQWVLLLTLAKYQKEPMERKNQTNNHSRISAYWENFMKDAESALSLSRDEILDQCTRLIGTGLMYEILGAPLIGEPLIGASPIVEPSIGYLTCTPTFFKLKKYVEQSADE